MLDSFLFRTAEGLCRKFSGKAHSRGRPWGGRHVILLGDPAPAPCCRAEGHIWDHSVEEVLCPVAGTHLEKQT